MTGLLMIGATIVWLVVALSLATLISRRFLKKTWQLPMTVILVVLLVPLPIIDEIIGRSQFTALCEQAREIKVDARVARGRSVELKRIPHPALFGYTTIPRRNVPNTIVPIREDSWDYIDTQSDMVLLSFKTYEAAGGWLIRTLGVSEGNVPLTFYGYCEPQGKSTIFEELSIKKIEGQSHSPERVK